MPPPCQPAPLLIATCCALGSCSWLTPDQEIPAPNPNTPKLVGRIASIPPDRRFVLIQSYGTWTVPAGTVLAVHGPDGRNANLTATGESLKHYAAADLVSGTLEVGDGVYVLPKPTPSPPTSLSEPEMSAE